MSQKTVQDIVAAVMKQAAKHGFGTAPEEIDVAEKIALIHSEISEAYEAYRHQNMDGKDGFKEELADAIQRILHLCGVFSIDIEQEIVKKIASNENRAWDWEHMNERHT